MHAHNMLTHYALDNRHRLDYLTSTITPTLIIPIHHTSSKNYEECDLRPQLGITNMFYILEKWG